MSKSLFLLTAFSLLLVVGNSFAETSAPQQISPLAPASQEGPQEGAADETAQVQKAPLPPLQLRPLVFGETLTVNATSRGIVWQGRTFYLVQIPTLEFTLTDDELKATTTATLTTFDSAPYRTHVSVFDGSGTLLGTATADCETQRAWLGTVLAMQRELTFDFGKSIDYKNAKFFSLAITNHELQTPDQWQK